MTLNYILLQFIFFILFGTQTREQELSIVLQLPPHLLTLTINIYKTDSLEILLKSVDTVSCLKLDIL